MFHQLLSEQARKLATGLHAEMEESRRRAAAGTLPDGLAVSALGPADPQHTEDDYAGGAQERQGGGREP